MYDTQKIKRKEYQHNIIDSYYTDSKKKGSEGNYKNRQKTFNKMAVSTHLLIF